ncbi:MAG: hypothetical protein OQJ89_02980 [Kangiellaceae bacterium]|nr:hypothetical protein [Kangiellaceae bacterium]MCW8999237.1 hypothetical protein [Kangiellaceae bacterium]MCW9015910.1 hypothetical protein [Kangiellaceae bacterium]
MPEVELGFRTKTRQFIENNMNVFDEDIDLTDETNIFTSGFVNSTFAMRLLNFLENEFSITVPDDEILLSNFSSVDSMWSLTSKLKGETV